MSERRGRPLNRAELADFTGRSLPTIDAWVRTGCPFDQRGGKGKGWIFNSADVLDWLEARAAERASENAPKGELDPAQERARKDKALAETAELRNAVTRGELVRYDDVERDVREVLLATRERFLAVPVEVQTDMPPEVAQLAHDVVRNRLYAAMEDMAADGDAQVLAEAEARKGPATQVKQRRLS